MPGQETHDFDLVMELVPESLAEILGVAFDTDDLLGQILDGVLSFGGAFKLDVSMDRPTDVSLPADALNPIDVRIELLGGLGSVRIVAGVDTDRSADGVDLIQVNLRDRLYHAAAAAGPIPLPSNVLRDNLQALRTIPLLPVPVERGTADPKKLERADVKIIDDTSGSDRDAVAFCLTFGDGGPGDLAAFTRSFLRPEDTGGLAIFFGWLCRILAPEVERALGLPEGDFEGCVLRAPFRVDEDEEVDLTALSLELRDGFIALSASVRKTGFCYEGTGTIGGRIRVEVEDGNLVVQADVDDPEIDVDVPWYCWLTGAALAAILGGVLFGVIGAIVGGVLVPLILFIVSETVEGVLQAIADTLAEALDAIAPDVEVPAVVFNLIFQQVFIDDITIAARVQVEDSAPVKSEGTVVLRPGQAVDLDTGRVGDTELPGADLEWTGSGRGRRLRTCCISELARTGSADFGGHTRFRLYGLAYQSPGQVPVDELGITSDLVFYELLFPSLIVYAVRTNEGNYSVVQVVEVKDAYIRLRYRTYAYQLQSVQIQGAFRCAPILLPEVPKGDLVFEPPGAGDGGDDVDLPPPPDPPEEPDCPREVVVQRAAGRAGALEARVHISRLIEASRAVGAEANVAVFAEGEPVARLDALTASRWSRLGPRALRLYTGRWVAAIDTLRYPRATFHAVTEGLSGELTYQWFVNGDLLGAAEGTVDARGLVLAYGITDNRVTFTVKKGGDQPRDFELKVAVGDSEGAHLEAIRCIHYEGRCRHTRRRSPPYETYLAQWAT
jgi:hypothetical protein